MEGVIPVVQTRTTKVAIKEIRDYIVSTPDFDAKLWPIALENPDFSAVASGETDRIVLRRLASNLIMAGVPISSTRCSQQTIEAVRTITNRAIHKKLNY